jgi:large subunit ribosomal protein L17
MRHRKRSVKLSRTASHRRAMFRNMVTSLLGQERIETTVAKAKEARRFTDRMVTLAKRGTLHARRQALTFIMDQDVVSKLFDELARRYADRNGGYTRIIRTGFRRGDGAELAILELVGRLAPKPEPEKKKKDKKSEAPEEAEEAAETNPTPEPAEGPLAEEKPEKKPRAKRRGKKKASEGEEKT